MRFEKFTTKLQEALAEAQSNALGQDHQYIEPQHLLLALLDDEGVSGLIAKAGGNPGALKKSLAESVSRLPKVEGTPGEVHLSRELSQLLNVADKEAQKRGDQYIASEMFLLAARRQRRAGISRRGEAGAGKGDRRSARRRKRFFASGRRTKAGARQVHIGFD